MDSSSDDEQAQQPQGQGEAVNMDNYKGIYFEQEHEKYICPVTGAHFRFD